MSAAEDDAKKYVGFTGECYPEPFITMPPQPTEKKPGQLPIEKVKEFFDQGFVVADGFFTEEDMEPITQSFAKLIDELAQKLHNAGHVKNLYENCNNSDRLMNLEREWPGAVTLLVKHGVLTPEFQAIYQNEKLLNAIEQFIGPEIGANGVWTTRPKAPGHSETDVPWHQDSAYLDHDGYKTLIVTAWIACVDATEENGCLQFVRNGHRKGLVVLHEVGNNDFYITIKEGELENRLGVDPKTNTVSAPMKKGGVVFFTNLTPHRSMPNKSDHVRFGMDLRFQNPNAPWGYFGLSKGILLRSPSKPDHVPDWHFYQNQDRFDKYKEDVEKKVGHEVDEFDTIITGPHMERWPIVKRNKHIDTHFAKKDASN